MHGIELTYRILAQTRNEAAVATLAQAIVEGNPKTRRRALTSLVQRPEERAADLLIEYWNRLDADDCRVIRGDTQRVERAILRRWKDETCLAEAIAACETLQLAEQIPALIPIAESSPESSLRDAATRAILQLSESLGEAARLDRPVATLRDPALLALAESVKRLSAHRNFELVDAFLVASAWGDTQLRHWVADTGALGQTIRGRLAESMHRSIPVLLAGYLRRRRVEPAIYRVIKKRDDDWFRDAILRTIGVSPSGATLKNLREIGIPNVLVGGLEWIATLLPDQRAALVHAYWAGSTDTTQVIQIATEALRAGGKGVPAAVGLALSRCPIPDADWLMRAVMPVAKLLEKQNVHCDAAFEKIGSESLTDPRGKWVARLIDNLQHPDASVRKGAARMLSPLHAENMLPRFDPLRPSSRRRLGRMVARIDRDAVSKVRDALRHPVLERRLEAIATAESLAIVETLNESFAPIARDDHQLARVRAAQAMSSATDPLTRTLLEEMLLLPESQVRDAAENALALRSDPATPQPNETTTEKAS